MHLNAYFNPLESRTFFAAPPTKRGVMWAFTYGANRYGALQILWAGDALDGGVSEFDSGVSVLMCDQIIGQRLRAW